MQSCRRGDENSREGSRSPLLAPALSLRTSSPQVRRRRRSLATRRGGLRRPRHHRLQVLQLLAVPGRGPHRHSAPPCPHGMCCPCRELGILHVSEKKKKRLSMNDRFPIDELSINPSGFPTIYSAVTIGFAGWLANLFLPCMEMRGESVETRATACTQYGAVETRPPTKGDFLSIVGNMINFLLLLLVPEGLGWSETLQT